MVFGGGILGGARKIWGNPYLNSTTVLFDDTQYIDKFISMQYTIKGINFFK